MFTTVELQYLGIFFVIFMVSLAMDIGAHRHQKATIRNALLWTVVWMLISVAFAGVTAWMLGGEYGNLYLAGWVLEKTLAVDNLFAFMAVFASFGLRGEENEHAQHRILHYGILGAIFFRVIMLAGMGFLLNLQPPWNQIVTVIFALVVFATAIGMIRAMRKHEEEVIDYTNHWSVRLTRKFMRIEPSIAGGKFFIRKTDENGHTHTYATMSFLCLVCIEAVDIGFSFDSMPAIAAVVKYPPIMISASLMAIAGLRALYFALLAAVQQFKELEKAVIVLLFYIPIKLIVEEFQIYHISSGLNLGIIGLTIAIGIGASFLLSRNDSK